jgi:prepilin-type N-terminal cleavage/methylation domain-containing protein
MTKPGSASRADGQSGVTLVEVIVALAITVLTLAIAAGGLRLLSRSGERGAQVIARHDIVARGVDVLRRDIERLERVVWKRGDNAELLFRGDAANLRFVAIEPPFPAEAGPYVIAYSIAQGREGAVLARERAPFRANGDIDRLATADTVAVLEGPYRLRFLYLDRKDDRERWLPQWTDRNRLPALITLELSDPAGNGGPVSIVFRPRIDAERSCVKDEGGSCTIGTGGALASQDGPQPGGRKE